MKDQLYRKAFWTFFSGLMAVSVFDLLPLMLFGMVRSDAPTTLTLFEFSIYWTVGSAVLILIWTWWFIANATINLRAGAYRNTVAYTEELQARIREGRLLMQYGNLVGLFGRFVFWYVRFTFSASPELNQMASIIGPTPDELSELVPKIEDGGK